MILKGRLITRAPKTVTALAPMAIYLRLKVASLGTGMISLSPPLAPLLPSTTLVATVPTESWLPIIASPCHKVSGKRSTIRTYCLASIAKGMQISICDTWI